MAAVASLDTVSSDAHRLAEEFRGIRMMRQVLVSFMSVREAVMHPLFLQWKDQKPSLRTCP